MMETGQYVAKFREKAHTGMGPISFGGFTSDFATQYATHYMKGSPFSYDDWQEGDDLWRQIQGEVDPEKRKKLSQDLVRKLSRERVPNVPLVATNALTALGPKVTAYPRPDAEPYLTGLHTVRLKSQPAETSVARPKTRTGPRSSTPEAGGVMPASPRWPCR
jgi:ABC-type transport system substrate-binding protein